jgi:hypothetical protein
LYRDERGIHPDRVSTCRSLPLTAVIIQPVITDGTEVTISMLHEQVLGPLIYFPLKNPRGGA